jgi:hypothetical protein
MIELVTITAVGCSFYVSHPRKMYAKSVTLNGFIEAAGNDFSWSYPEVGLHSLFHDQENLIDLLL